MLEGEEEWIGQTATCPSCGKEFTIQAVPGESQPSAENSPALEESSIPEVSSAQEEPPQPKERKSRRGKFLALAAGFLVIVILGVCALLFFRHREDYKEEVHVGEVHVGEVHVGEVYEEEAFQPEEMPFGIDIDRMVSGLPQARKPSEPFQLDKNLSRVIPPQKTPYASSFHDGELENMLDGEMVYSVQAGDVWDVFCLLEHGFDINGLYQRDYGGGGSWKAEPRDTLLAYLFDGLSYSKYTRYNRLELDQFIRMFLFLAENGIDLEKPDSQGRTPMDRLLMVCAKDVDPDLWRLIPYLIAKGVSVEQFTLQRIKNPDLKDYLDRSLREKQTPPVPREDVRLNTFAQDAKNLKLSESPLENPIRLFNPGFKNDLFWCEHQRQWLKMDDFTAFFKKGFNPNAILICTWQGHGAGNPRRDGENLVSHHVEKGDVRTQCFLLSNGWRYGMERTFRNLHDPTLLRMYWEFGANVTVDMLNKAKGDEEYDLLRELWSKQQSHFGKKGIKPRGEDHWNRKKAHEAVFKGDIAALKELLDKGVDVNAPSEDFPPLLCVACDRRASDGGPRNRSAGEMVRFLLEQGADPNSYSMQSRRSAFEIAIRAPNPDGAKLLWATGKIARPEPDSRQCTPLCEIINTLTYVHMWKELEEAYIEMFDFLIDEVGLPIHEKCWQLREQSPFDKLVSEPYSESSFKEQRCFYEWLEGRGYKPSREVLEKTLQRLEKIQKKTPEIEEYREYLEKFRE